MPSSSPRSVLRFDDGGWAEAIGNHLALDLVNTVAWRLDPSPHRRPAPRRDRAGALGRLRGARGRRQAAAFTAELRDDPRADLRITAQVRRARERLHRVLQPVAVGAEPAATDVAALRRGLLGALGRAEVGTVMPLEWSTGLRSVSDLPDELALAAWRLLQHEDRAPDPAVPGQRLRLAVPRPHQERLPRLVQLRRLRQPLQGAAPLRAAYGGAPVSSRTDFADGCPRRRRPGRGDLRARGVVRRGRRYGGLGLRGPPGLLGLRLLGLGASSRS